MPIVAASLSSLHPQHSPRTLAAPGRSHLDGLRRGLLFLAAIGFAIYALAALGAAAPGSQSAGHFFPLRHTATIAAPGLEGATKR